MGKWIDITEVKGFEDEDRYDLSDPLAAFAENLYEKYLGPVDEEDDSGQHKA